MKRKEASCDYSPCWMMYIRCEDTKLTELQGLTQPRFLIYLTDSHGPYVAMASHVNNKSICIYKQSLFAAFHTYLVQNTITLIGIGTISFPNSNISVIVPMPENYLVLFENGDFEATFSPLRYTAWTGKVIRMLWMPNYVVILLRILYCTGSIN